MNTLTRHASVKEMLVWAESELTELGSEEAKNSAEWLLAGITGMQRTELYVCRDRLLDGSQIRLFSQQVAKRKKRVPLAYITGKAYFWEEELEVGPACLIPRPETERLIEVWIEAGGFSREQAFSFLDLGTGSGAIAVALLRHFQRARAAVSDIAPETLETARKNLAAYGLLERTQFFESNLFEALKGRRWDAVFCNPPYLSVADLKAAQPELRSEPERALAGGEDGLDFYRKIAAQAKDYLLPEGQLVLEIGIRQGLPVETFLRQAGFCEIRRFRDDAGIERVITAK